MSAAFPPAVRLRSRREYDAVQRGGRRVSARFVTLLARPGAAPHDRLGLVASRKIGGAVIRNRAKRRLREIFRQLEPAAPDPRPLDLVAIARRELVDAPHAIVEADFRAALKKLRGTGGSR